jgi:hypothetical protein
MEKVFVEIFIEKTVKLELVKQIKLEKRKKEIEENPRKNNYF